MRREMEVSLEKVASFMMVGMEGCTIGLTIMASTVIGRGMSPFVFVTYTNALSSIFLLLPYCSNLILCLKDSRKIEDESLCSLSLIIRIACLGLTGITIAQNLAFLGLSYSSPILACGMGNLIPTFCFILSIAVSRETRFNLRDSSTIVKIVGSAVSIIGAVSVTIYKGPVISTKQYSGYSPILHVPHQLFIFSSRHEHWVLGGIFLAAASLSFSIWNVIQVGTVRQYPYPMKIATAYTIAGTIQTAIVSIVMERDPSAWIINLDKELLVIVLYAIFGSVIRSRVHIWCTKLKGPLYVAFFKPMGILFATLCGCIFFADSFHYGSILGAAMVGMGYYTLMWGQIIEDEKSKENENKIKNYDSSENEALLLRDHSQV